jgi:hypothetical protein
VVAISPNGRYLASRTAGAVQVIDLLGVSPRRDIEAGDDAFAFVGESLWLANATRLRRVELDSGTIAVTALSLDGAVRAIRTAADRDTSCAAICADSVAWVETGAAGTVVRAVDGDVFPVGGRRVVVARDGEVRLATIGRASSTALPARGIRAAVAVWGERALALWAADDEEIVVATTTGKAIHRIAVANACDCTFAGGAGLGFALVAGELWAFDLRYGRVVGTSEAPGAASAIASDRDARRIAVGDGRAVLGVYRYAELFERAAEPPPSRDREPRGVEQVLDAPTVEAAPNATPVEVDVALPELAPIALAPAPARPPAIAAHDAVPFASASEHTSALLDLVAARAALAIAEGWHSGRISHDVDGGLPNEHEVLGLVGDDIGLAGDALRRARARLAERTRVACTRTPATIAAGIVPPFVELALDFSLSPIATQVLACIAAPHLRAEIARLYGVLAGIAGRTWCDLHLVELLLARDVERDRIASALAGDGALVRWGLVRVERDDRGMRLTIGDVLADRLRGHARAVDISPVTVRRAADVDLADVMAPIAAKRDLLLALADRDDARPPRVVIRGRRGSGRHTLIAALAARVGCTIAAIDVERLPRGTAAFGAALRAELANAAIARAVPVVSGFESLDPKDAELLHHAREIVRAHPGPIAIRAGVDDELPIAPGFAAVVLPPLSLGDRALAWQRALARRALANDGLDVDALAARFRFGAGTIHRVCDEVARRARRDGGRVAALVDDIARQHVAARLARIATRVERLPDWDRVTLADEMKDSVRELVGRARWERRVYEDWGMSRCITTARGHTALFYGPPGTGKTLVAGLIARELGLELWRVDLARVMSKWVGETEKNLGEVFDAAEEGQIMLLFDEADSLFAKRTEVRTSNDRYANLEVNYLLQRLDSFDGVAVLTTNLEGSVDEAFKRRLSMRLYFAFPDEEQRAELWAAHVPRELPVDGKLDFAELARRYPLSGGYIRNSVLRATFLAAQEQRALCHEHLVRAVQLEYRELGKLSTSGRVQ